MKKISKIKRLFVLCLVFLLSINSFAAVVSDNDGSVFITKPEFDLIKNQFQASIDSYTTSIDSKIENAITSYLKGVPAQNQYLLPKNESMVSYPLKIYNTEFNWTLTNWNETTADTNGDGIWQRYDKRWWAPNTTYWSNYNYCNATYGFVAYILKLQHIRDDLNQITSFYNGVANTTTGIFKIKNRWDNVSCTNVCAALDDVKASGWQLGGKAWIMVRHDLKGYTAFNDATDAAFTTRRDDASALCSTKYNILNEPIEANNYVRRYIYTAYYATGAIPVFVDDAAYGRLGRYQGEGNWLNTEIPYADYKKINNDDVKLTKTETNKIEILYNYATDENLLPVANNEQIYYSNKIDLKQDIYNDYKNDAIHLPEKYAKRWWAGSERDDMGEVPYWMGFVDTGFCIEPEGWGASTHTWDKRALIKMDRARYEVQGVVDKNVYDLKLTDGIFLTQIPYDADVCEIKLDITQETNTNPKNIIISNKPISRTTTPPLTDLDFYTIYENKSDTAGNKYKLLENDENKMYLKNIAKGTNIYIKIVWSNTDKTFTQINSTPIVNITTSS